MEYEEKESEESIFHVKKSYLFSSMNHKSTLQKLEKTVEGKVVGFGEGEFKEKRANEKGILTYLFIETPRGAGKIEFPREFSEDRKDRLRNQAIKYSSLFNYYDTHAHDPDGDDGQYEKYRIDVLSGPLKGEFFEGTVDN